MISLAGCVCLRLCAEWNLGAGAAANLMGGMPDEVPERYAVADPATLHRLPFLSRWCTVLPMTRYP